MTAEPTFLFCVGATKAGTSWLYRYLARHPECHLRSIKELHYFDMLESGNYARHRDREARRLAALRDEAASGAPMGPFRARMLRDTEEWCSVIGHEGENLDAYRTYLAGERGVRHLVGDITPAYALLPVARLAQMARMAGDVRFVYLLRDPVSRLWSQARMVAYRKARSLAEFPARAAEVMGAMIDGVREGRTDREDYIGAIGRLRESVAASRLFVQLQDEMMSLPGLARLCGFLGIAAVPADFDKRVHEGTPLALDEGLRARAQAALRPQYDFVATLFPELPDSWRRNMIGVHG